MFCTGGGRALKIRQVHAPLPPAIQLAADRAVCPVLLLRNPIERSQHSRSCEPPDDFPCKKTEAYPTDSKKLSSGAPWMGPPLIGIYRPLHPRLVWHDKGNDQTRPNTRDNSGEEFPVLLEHGLSHRVEPLGPTKGTAKHPSGMAQSQRDGNPVEKSREAQPRNFRASRQLGQSDTGTSNQQRDNYGNTQVPPWAYFLLRDLNEN